MGKETIIDKMKQFNKDWNNYDEKDENGSVPFTPHQFYIMDISMDFRFKYFVSREDLEIIAKELGEELPKDKRTIDASVGETNFEFEEHREGENYWDKKSDYTLLQAFDVYGASRRLQNLLYVSGLGWDDEKFYRSDIDMGGIRNFGRVALDEFKGILKRIDDDGVYPLKKIKK